MTDYQKKRITLMRKQNVGYATIAKELRLSLGAVKQFCRRNDLQSDDLETDTQHENYAEPPLENDLISVESRGKIYDKDGNLVDWSADSMKFSSFMAIPTVLSQSEK